MFKKIRKISNKVWASIISIGVITIATPIAIVQMQLANQTATTSSQLLNTQKEVKSIPNESLKANFNSQQSRTANGFMTGDFIVNPNNELELSDADNNVVEVYSDGEYSFNTNYYRAVPDGIVALNKTNGKQIIKIDENSNKVLWTNDVFSNFEYVLKLEYDSVNKAIVAIGAQNSGGRSILTIAAINAENGQTITTQELFNDASGYYSKSKSNWINFLFVPVDNKADSFIFWDGNSRSLASRMSKSKIITFNGTGFDFVTPSATYGDSGNYTTISVSATYDSNENAYYFAEVTKWESKNVWLLTYKNGGQVRDSKMREASDETLINDNAWKNVNRNSYLHGYNNGSGFKLEWSWIWTTGKDYVPHNDHNGLYFYGDYNPAKQDIGTPEFIGFNDARLDLDLLNSYIQKNPIDNKTYIYFSVRYFQNSTVWKYIDFNGNHGGGNPGDAKYARGILRIKLSDPSSGNKLNDPNSFLHWARNADNDRIQLYVPDTFNAGWDPHNCIILPSYNGDKIYNFLGGSKYYTATNINENDKKGSHAYVSEQKIKEYQIPGVDNEPASDYRTNEKLKQLVPKEEIQKLFTRIPSDFDYNFESFTTEPNDDTLGIVRAKIAITKAFDSQGNKQEKIVFPEYTVFNGFKKRVTDWKVNDNDQIDIHDVATEQKPNALGWEPFKTKLPTQVTVEDLKDWAFGRRFHILYNPTDMTKEDIEITSHVANNETRTLTVTFTYKKKYVDGVIVNDSLPPRTVVFTGFKESKPTKWSVAGDITVDAKDSTGPFHWMQIAMYNPNQFTVEIIKEWALSQFKDLLLNTDNFPSISTADVEVENNQISIDNQNNTVTARFKFLKGNNENGVYGPINLDYKTVTFTNLEDAKPTVFPEQPVKLGLDGSSNTINATYYARQVNDSDLKHFIFRKLNDIIKWIPNDIKEEEINIKSSGEKIDSVLVNPTDGSREGQINNIKFTIPRYFDKSGNLVNQESQEVTINITGFNQSGITTTIPSTILLSFNNLEINYKASEWEQHQDQIKEIIVSLSESNASYGVSNFQPNYGTTGYKKLKKEHITLEAIKNPAVNDKDGTIKVKVKISDQVAWEVGVNKAVEAEITLKGFKTQLVTKYKQNVKLSTTTSDKYPDDGNIQNIVKDIVWQNKDTVFENLPPQFTRDNIIVGNMTPDRNLGTLTVNIKTNTYYDPNNGLLVQNAATPLGDGTNIFIDGFRGDHVTTNIPNNTIKFEQTPNFKASQWNASEDNINVIKDEVIKNVIHIATGQTLQRTDINLTEATPNELDNINGTIKLNVEIINNKAMQDGIAQSTMSLNGIKFTNFKGQLPPTGYASKTFINDASSFASMVSTDYQEKHALEYVFKHQDKFFVNAPADLTKDDIVIVNGSFNNSDLVNGLVKFKVQLKKYVNADGDIIDNNGTLFPSDPAQAVEFTLEGFKKVTSVSTSLKEHAKNIDANNKGSLFATIFKDDKGFSIDWNGEEVISQKRNKLIDYIQRNITDFISGHQSLTDPNIKTKCNGISTAPKQGNTITVTLQFSNWFNNNVASNHTEDITITLKETPKGDVVIKTQLSEELKKHPDALTPTVVKDKIIATLNNPEVQNNLPNALIPSGGFTIDHINNILPDDQIQISENQVNIPAFDIKVGDQAIKFDAMNITYGLVSSSSAGSTSVVIWVVIGVASGILFFIILLMIANTIKRSKLKNDYETFEI